MAILDKLKNFIQDLDEKQFLRYLAGLFITLVILMSLILFFNYRKVHGLKKRIVQINNNRTSLQAILTTYERVKQQKADVAAMLEKDKNFKIVGYMDTLLNSLNLTGNRSNYTQSSEVKESLPEYIEVKLVTNFTSLNTRQLVELLHEIEKNERIYTKELEITRSPSTPTLDVVLTIATLEARTQGTETE
jgi:hypothetical protein